MEPRLDGIETPVALLAQPGCDVGALLDAWRHFGSRQARDVLQPTAGDMNQHANDHAVTLSSPKGARCLLPSADGVSCK